MKTLFGDSQHHVLLSTPFYIYNIQQVTSHRALTSKCHAIILQYSFGNAIVFSVALVLVQSLVVLCRGGVGWFAVCTYKVCSIRRHIVFGRESKKSRRVKRVKRGEIQMSLCLHQIVCSTNNICHIQTKEEWLRSCCY